jgi:hypothetical protein
MSPYCNSLLRFKAFNVGAIAAVRLSPEGWQKIAGGKPAPPPEHPPNVTSHPEGVTDHRGDPFHHGFHVRLAPGNSARDGKTHPGAEKYNVPLLRFLDSSVLSVVKKLLRHS